MQTQRPAVSRMTYAPEYGRPVRVREFERPMLSDDVETAQTIAYMEELACFDAGERHVIEATHRALAEGGCTVESTPREIASAIFAFLKRTIRYVPTPATSALVDQTLIAPSALLQMPDPEGDCPQFSMLAMAMFRNCCVPCFFVTIAADPRYPTIFSHVYNTVQVGPGRFMPFDSSNGPEPGAEYMIALKKRVWPATNPQKCRVKGKAMIRSTRRLGALCEEGDLSCLMTGPSVSLSDPALQMDSSSSYGQGGGPAWLTTLINAGAGIGSQLIRANSQQQQPYYVTSANGQRSLYNPATGQSQSVGGGISFSSPMMLIGIAVIVGLAMSRPK